MTNVTAFGAFVDIGVHQDGLVHISELSDNFVRDPNDVVKPQQKVSVYVLEVDKARRRISLSMKSNPQKRAASAGDIARVGQRKPFAKPSRDGGGSRPQQGGSINDAWTSAFNNIKFGR